MREELFFVCTLHDVDKTRRQRHFPAEILSTVTRHYTASLEYVSLVRNKGWRITAGSNHETKSRPRHHQNIIRIVYNISVLNTVCKKKKKTIALAWRDEIISCDETHNINNNNNIMPALRARDHVYYIRDPVLFDGEGFFRRPALCGARDPSLEPPADRNRLHLPTSADPPSRSFSRCPHPSTDRTTRQVEQPCSNRPAAARRRAWWPRPRTCRLTAARRPSTWPTR